MNTDTIFSKLQLVFMGLIGLIALSILADFEFSSISVEEPVMSKSTKLENKQSTGRNYYYATHLITDSHRIPVSQDFADTTEKGHLINYEVSLLYDEVNKVTNVTAAQSEKFSFRWMTGCIIPLFVIGVLWFGVKRREKLSTLVFVAQVVLIIDFVFLLN